MNNQKDFANIILVVVIVILVGGIGYFVFVKKSEPVAQQPTPTPTQTNTPVSPTPTPTPNPTANWKIYANSQYGFEVKYPADWQSVVNSNISGDIIFLVGFKPSNLQGETWANVYVSSKKLGFLQQVNKELTQGNLIITLQNSGDSKYKSIENQIFTTFKITSQIVTTSEKPIITNTSGAVIKGKTKANYLVWAYGAGQSCLTRNSMASYGADKADVNGNFSINIPTVAADGNVSIVVAAFPENSTFIRQGTGGTDSCFPSSNISEAVIFTVAR